MSETTNPREEPRALPGGSGEGAPRAKTSRLAWLDALEISEVATTAVTAAELRYGVARLPDGHRKRELTVVIRSILAEEASSSARSR